MTPTLGRIIHYTLTQQDVDQIMRRRTSASEIASRMAATPPGWPAGAQAHIGNTVRPGQIVPVIIVAVWSEVCINGRAMLDGTDEYWVSSAMFSPEPNQGMWHWPERAP